MASLYVTINKKISIASYRRVRTALEGEYSSVFKGRSMDFDDLREYIPGDEIKDIDWKATARSGSVLTRRYIATRKQNILLVVDTGRSMAATAPSGDSKREISVMVAGIMASVAQKHADLIGMVAGNSEQIHRMPLKESRSHIERILQYINTKTSVDAPSSDLTKLLEYIRRNIQRRMLLIVISDNLQLARAQEDLLRRLAAQHELLFIAVNDLDPADESWNSRDLFDVNEPVDLPAFIRKQKKVETAYRAFISESENKTQHILKRTRISSIRINSSDEAISKIVRLLEEHRHAKYH